MKLISNLDPCRVCLTDCQLQGMKAVMVPFFNVVVNKYLLVFMSTNPSIPKSVFTFIFLALLCFPSKT